MSFLLEKGNFLCYVRIPECSCLGFLNQNCSDTGWNRLKQSNRVMLFWAGFLTVQKNKKNSPYPQICLFDGWSKFTTTNCSYEMVMPILIIPTNINRLKHLPCISCMNFQQQGSLYSQTKHYTITIKKSIIITMHLTFASSLISPSKNGFHLMTPEQSCFTCHLWSTTIAIYPASHHPLQHLRWNLELKLSWRTKSLKQLSSCGSVWMDSQKLTPFEEVIWIP